MIASKFGIIWVLHTLLGYRVSIVDVVPVLLTNRRG